MALALGTANAMAAVPGNPRATAADVAEAKRVLQAAGYSGVAVLSSDNQLVTASVVKDGAKSLVDVDPLTGIILPHVALAPLPARMAPITGLPANPR